MKKISTLFKKDPNDLGRVINEINPENQWVFDGNGIATRKFDGTACAIFDGELYRRYDCKIDKNTGLYKRQIPSGAIPCQEADKLSGHHPHWIKCRKDNPSDKYHFEAFDKLLRICTDEFNINKYDGTYELCGEKIQGNPENIKGHRLIKHGVEKLYLANYEFESLNSYFKSVDIEGIVFHNVMDGRMCKIRKSDFGIKRIINQKQSQFEK